MTEERALDAAVDVARRASAPARDDDALIARAMLAGAKRHEKRTTMRAIAAGAGVLAIAACVWLVVQASGPDATEVARTTQLRLPAGDALTARAGTRFLVEADTSAERSIRLERGAMLFEVEPLARGERFEVHTPDLSLRVVGTIFVVTVGDEGTRVSVFEGRVRIDGEPQSVSAGDERVQGEAPAIARELADRARRAARERIAARDEDATPVAAPAVDREVGAREERVSDARAELEAERLARHRAFGISGAEETQLPPENRPRARGQEAAIESQTPPAPAAEGSEPRADDAPRHALGAPEDPLDLASIRRLIVAGQAERALALAQRARASGPDDGQARLLEADALRALDRHREAADAYDDAAQRLPAAQRETAGFLAARVRMSRLRDPRGALASIDRSRAAAETSPLAERALVLRIRALSALDRREEAATAAREYLRRHPSGANADEMRAMGR